MVRNGTLFCFCCLLFVQLSSEVRGDSKVGIVKVVSDPVGAMVYLNGRVYGPTPVLLELTSGKHALVVTLDGYPPKVQDVSVSTGRLTEMFVSFADSLKKNAIRVHQMRKGGADAGPGTVTIITEPPGLTVLVDDRVVQKRTPVAFDIHSGIYRLKIEQDGQVVMEKTLFVRAGRVEELDFTIRKRRSIDDMDPWR